MARELRHPAGHRWLVICTAIDGSAEWIIDGAADRAAAEKQLEKWAGRGTVEWRGAFEFRLVEATR